MAGKHQTTDAAHLRALIANSVTTEDMAAAFGVHKTAISRWIKDDKAPLWTVPASSYFTTRGKKMLLVGIIDKDKWATAEVVFVALGFEKIGVRGL